MAASCDSFAFCCRDHSEHLASKSYHSSRHSHVPWPGAFEPHLILPSEHRQMTHLPSPPLAACLERSFLPYLHYTCPLYRTATCLFCSSPGQGLCPSTHRTISSSPFHLGLFIDSDSTRAYVSKASFKRHLNPGSINLPFSFPQISSELPSLTPPLSPSSPSAQITF